MIEFTYLFKNPLYKNYTTQIKVFTFQKPLIYYTQTPLLKRDSK